ncbi:major facilitator superfamily domain-containing protein [Armillaria mellea]|nr:major facilitator superfamily domain-containing protein [Armillaria mellea]
MSAYSHHSPHIVNPSIRATVSDDKQGLQAMLDIKNDDRIDLAMERRLLRRLDLRIILSMTILCTLNLLARTNIGNARILNADTGNSILQVLHMTDHQFLITLMVFLIPYALLAAPSSYMLKHFSPPCWLAFCALGWGAIDIGIAASQNYATLVALRTGLFPGIIYLLTFWYHVEERPVRITTITAALALGGALSGFIAYGAGHLNRDQVLFSGGVSFFIQGVLPPTSVKARYAMFCIGTMSVFASMPLLMIWLTENLRDTHAMTLAIPMYGTFGSLLGQITGIFIYKPSEAPGYPTGHYTNGSLLLLGALCAGALRVIYTRSNNALDVGETRWMV